MGCASSKVLASEFAAEKGNTGFSKSISMPALPLQELPDDFHIVALTSSTYGILKIDPPKLPEEDSMEAHSVKDVLSKLNNLESKAEAAPQSWLEVSSMLENIKPDLEKSGKSGKKPQQPDAIDIKDIMMDLDEDTGLVRPKARRLANLRKAGKSLPIYTLEELDKRLGGKLDNGVSPTVSIADLRASLKPVRTDRESKGSRNMAANSSILQNNQQNMLSSVMDSRNVVIKKDSELVDDEFLGCYKNAFNTFSEDDWKVVEALCQEAVSDSVHGSEDEKHVIGTHLNVELKEKDAAKTSSASEDIFLVIEEEQEEENTSSSTKGSSLANSILVTGNRLLKGDVVTKKSPLEDYEELCPPGGKQAVVLYTTSLRGIRKTYEDCIKTREIVKSYGVLIDERDVSMHLEYRNELRELMQRVVTVPRLFVNGRYIGGAEAVVKLAVEGQLACLLEGSTRAHCGTGGAACDGCAGAKFVPCLECSGSCKVVNDEGQVMRCPDCNENGLIQCPICS